MIINKRLKYTILTIVIVSFIVLFFAPHLYARSFGGRVSSQISNAIKKQVRAAIVPTLKTKKNKIEYPKTMLFSKNKRYLAMLMEANYISIWDMEKGKEIDNISLKSIIPKDFAIDYNRKKIYLIDKQGVLYVKPIVAGEQFKRAKKLQKNYKFKFVRLSAERLVLMTVKNKILLFDKDRQKKLLATVQLNSSVNAIDIADRSNQIVVASRNKKLSLYNYSKQRRKLLMSQRWELSNTVDRVIINNQGTGLAIQLNNNNYAYTHKKTTKFKNIKQVNKQVLFINFAGDSLNVISKNNEVYRHNIINGDISNSKKIKTLQAEMMQFYKNGDYVLIPKKQGGVLLVDVKSDKKEAQLISTKSGWAVLDKQGRYDGNEDAFQDVSWDADGQLIDLDQFSEKYFEPGLLEKTVDKKQKMITAPAVEIEKGIYLPPEVTIKILTEEKTYRLPEKIELKIIAKVEDKPDTLHALSVYHNGKKISKTKIKSIKSNQEGSYGIKQWLLTIKPVVGRNRFNAEVKGWQDVIGQSQKRVFHVKQRVASKEPRMFMKSIGINKYQGKELLLDFAVSDARDIYKTFLSSTLIVSKGKNKQKDINIRTLMLNKQASKKAILSLFEKIKIQSNKNDMLVVFMSGHGMVVNNEWYFLPQEARTLRDPGHVSSVGLSAKELMDNFIDIPSQKIVLIIDACQSGAVTKDFNDFHQRRALRGLSRNTGIHIIAATRADQLAPEFGELGHGLFTYTLLNGMQKNSKGFYNADQWPKDGKLMVTELQKYAEKFVPALAHAMASKNYMSSGERGGLDETTIVMPVSSSQGQDFVIYR